MPRADAIIIGAGAAGLLCAALAGQRGRRVLLLDHSSKVAEKIRISGGGRCNFTNQVVTADNFLGADPSFCVSALKRYGPEKFIGLVKRHGIGFHEKHKGQLFCDESSDDIIGMLLKECERGGVERRQPCAVLAVSQDEAGFLVDTDQGRFGASRLVIATGGLSIPKIGATDFGYRIARQFKLKVVEPRPALVPLTFSEASWSGLKSLAGVAARVRIGSDSGALTFDEDLLFTHRGLSGPAVLQISSYWDPGGKLLIDLCPDIELAKELISAKDQSRGSLQSTLSNWLPKRLASDWLLSQIGTGRELAARKLAEIGNKSLEQLAAALKNWAVEPNGSEGFKRAEVTKGGIATQELSDQTMEANNVPGLHFIGEVVDVTGWLGGYNFQWAWSSAHAAAQAI